MLHVNFIFGCEAPKGKSLKTSNSIDLGKAGSADYSPSVKIRNAKSKSGSGSGGDLNARCPFE